MNPTIAAALTLAPAAAIAAPNLQLEFRTGAAVPSAGVGGTPTLYLSDLVSAGIPLWGAAAVRLDDHVSLGAFASYSVLFRKNCPASTSCSGHDVRAGIDLQVHPLGAAAVDPWAGVGFGYEWLTATDSGGGVTQQLGVRGFELASVEAGVDFALAPALGVGPFAALAFGQYDEASLSGPVSASSPVANKTLHEWLMLGVRATLRL
jgi:hypothetical protein